MTNTKTNRTSESGNVLFLILIGVALFAALSFAISYSDRGSSASAGRESALIASSEIVQYGTTIENAITQIRVTNRCTAEEISFERAPFDGSDTDYVNPSAPSDFSCHVFHKNGGRAAVRKVPASANDGRDWAYIETRVHRIGADQGFCGPECHELVLVLGGLSTSVCEKINERLINDPTIIQQDNGKNYENRKFTGVFDTLGSDDIDGNGVAGNHALCTLSDNGVNYYYHVLLPR